MKEKFCKKYERKIFHFGNSFFVIKKSKNSYEIEIPEKSTKSEFESTQFGKKLPSFVSKMYVFI